MWRWIFSRAGWIRPRRCSSASDVPEVTELTWLLTTLTPMPMLENCHSYKDKLAKGPGSTTACLPILC